MFLEHQISLFKLSLKDHVTLKIEKMPAKKFSFAITGINYILKYIKIENLYFTTVVIFYCK